MKTPARLEALALDHLLGVADRLTLLVLPLGRRVDAPVLLQGQYRAEVELAPAATEDIDAALKVALLADGLTERQCQVSSGRVC